MSVASILNKNDDINFSEIIVGTLTADTITARVINGGGGGGGGTIPTLAQVCEAGVGTYGNVSCGNKIITDIMELDFKESTGTKTCAFSIDPTSGCLRYTQASWDEQGLLYDTKYNAPAQSSHLAGTFAPNSAINSASLTGTYSIPLKFSFPNPVNRCRFSAGGMKVWTTYTFVGTQPNTITLNWSLGVLQPNTQNQEFYGEANVLQTTFTPVTGAGIVAFNVNDIELWYIQDAPFTDITLNFLTLNTGSKLCGDGIVHSISIDGLMSGSLDSGSIGMTVNAV
jgi:hypothetical protein